MPRYQWSDGAIAQVESITNAPGKVEAVLRAHEKADPRKLGELRQTLLAKGITNYVSCDGKADSLIIPEIKHPEQVLKLLSEGGWTVSSPTVTKTSEDKEIAADSAQEKLKKNALFASAMFYNLGNASCIASGYFRAKHNRDGQWTAHDRSELMTGVMFSVGDLLMTFYGHDKTKDPLTAFSDELRAHLQKDGIEIPRGAGVTPEEIHQSGFFPSVSRFLHENISSIKCLSEAAGGAFMIKAALKPGQFNGSKLGAGLLIATGWLSTLLLDRPHAPPYEFKPDITGDKMSTGHKIGNWIYENPRGRLAAPFGIANNLFNLHGALAPWKEKGRGEAWRFQDDIATAKGFLAAGSGEIDYGGKIGKKMVTDRAELEKNLRYHQGKRHDYAWNVLSAGSFMIAHTLFGLSGGKKSQRDVVDTRTFSNEILSVAANLLLSVPEGAKQLAVEDAADYVTTIKGVAMHRDDAIKAINERIEHLKRSPFMMNGNGSSGATR